jgi:serine/threonine protein kinase/tetratricopeptide (TPR) repeat protein
MAFGPVLRTFPDGALVAGRYRVVRFIAEGNRGEVYEAEDLLLREHIALKTLRPEHASRPEVLKQFKRELRLARRVTHPNVCRVFDLGEHRGGAGPDSRSRAVTFLTMELLQGETLREYVGRHGRIPPEQFLPLAEQMASALDAAHMARIIHRDFKSGNVVLLPSPNSPASPRVVVTDFGLALAATRDEDSLDSGSGAFIGTPSYMSPEQVEGLRVSPASDLYSFGVVLYEMVTGRLPFVGKTPLATARQRLHEAPPPPRTWAPELKPGWDTVLLRCLARKPRDRFATAAEIIAALRDVERTSSPARSPEPQQAQSPATTSPARRVVAVFPPRSLRPRPETTWLSTALAEVLSAELGASGQIRLLSGEEIARLRKELSLPEEEGFSGDTLRRILIHSKVDLVLTGTYLAIGQEGSSTLRLDLCLQDSAAGEAVAHLTETGPEQELLALLTRVGATLRKQLGLVPPTSEQAHRVQSAMPASREAARLYAEGLSALRNHDLAIAVERLEQVVKQEPDFALAHSALAAAYQGLFHAERAKDAARRAFELSEGLPHEERLLVQARHHEAHANWEAAIEAYRALVELCPDSVEYGTALASAQVSAGQPREAHATLEALRRLPPPLDEDARIDLAESLAMAALSNFEASRRHAEAAVERARRAGQWLIVGSAMTSEAFAVRNLGSPARAVELLEESERLFLVGGDRGGAARSMLGRAIALMDLMRLNDAKSVLMAVIHLAQEHRGSLLEGEWLGITGWLHCHLGNLTEALRLTREALVLYQELEMPAEHTHHSVQLAMVWRHQGALDEAQHLLDKAGRMAQAIGDDYTEAWAQHELGDLFIDRGDLPQARSRLKRALNLRQVRGLQPFMVDTELSLAKLALKEGDSEQALTRAEQACTFYAQQRNHDKEGWAQALLTRALLVRGETAQARRALSRAQALAGRSEDVFILAEVLLTGAWAAARIGSRAEREEAARQLQGFIARAQEGGLKGVELRARLSLAELHQANGVDSAPTECMALEQEASRLGYLAIAQKVRAVVRR